MEVVYKTLRELEITGKPILTVFNKMDLAASEAFFRDDKADMTVKISLKTGMGQEQLLSSALTEMEYKI